MKEKVEVRRRMIDMSCILSVGVVHRGIEKPLVQQLANYVFHQAGQYLCASINELLFITITSISVANNTQFEPIYSI